MKWFLIILVVLVLLAGSGYSAVWFYHADMVKKDIAQLQEMVDANAKNGEKLTIGEVTVSGFPKEFIVTIASLDIQAKTLEASSATMAMGEALGISMSFNAPLIIRSEITSNKTHIILPDDISMTIYEEGKEPQKFNPKFKKSLTMVFTLDKTPLDFMLASSSPFLWGQGSKVLDHFVSLTMGEPEGNIITGGYSNEVMFSYDNSFFKIANEMHPNNQQFIQLATRAKNFFISDAYWDWSREMALVGADEEALKSLEPVMDYLISFNKAAGNSNYDYNISYTGPRLKTLMQSVQTKQVPGKAEIIINPFDFSNNLYGMEGDAKLVMNQQEDPLPYGWFRMDITNYDTLIDYLVTMYNVMTASIAEAAAQSGGAIVVGIRELNQEDITAFKAFLQKVFTFSNDGKDIKLVFQREKGKEFYIGNYPIVQTIVIFQESIMQVQERARKAAEKAQQEAEEAAAAAAANDNQAEETEEKPVDEGITASEAVQ